MVVEAVAIVARGGDSTEAMGAVAAVVGGESTAGRRSLATFPTPNTALATTRARTMGWRHTGGPGGGTAAAGGGRRGWTARSGLGAGAAGAGADAGLGAAGDGGTAAGRGGTIAAGGGSSFAAAGAGGDGVGPRAGTGDSSLSSVTRSRANSAGGPARTSGRREPPSSWEGRDSGRSGTAGAASSGRPIWCRARATVSRTSGNGSAASACRDGIARAAERPWRAIARAACRRMSPCGLFRARASMGRSSRASGGRVADGRRLAASPRELDGPLAAARVR